MKLDTFLRKTWQGALAALAVTMMLGLTPMPMVGQAPSPKPPPPLPSFDGCDHELRGGTGCKNCLVHFGPGYCCFPWWPWLTRSCTETADKIKRELGARWPQCCRRNLVMT